MPVPSKAQKEFRRALEHARQWEKACARWVRGRGWAVVPTYDFGGEGNNKAPKLLSPVGTPDLVLPDLQCFRSGTLRWLEVKFKREASLYRNTGSMVTGINRRLWRQYRRVESATSGQVVIVFIHEKEQEVRGDFLSNLALYVHHEYPGGKMGEDGMVFWNFTDIPVWGSLASFSALLPENQ